MRGEEHDVMRGAEHDVLRGAEHDLTRMRGQRLYRVLNHVSWSFLCLMFPRSVSSNVRGCLVSVVWQRRRSLHCLLNSDLNLNSEHPVPQAGLIPSGTPGACLGVGLESWAVLKQGVALQVLTLSESPPSSAQHHTQPGVSPSSATLAVQPIWRALCTVRIKHVQSDTCYEVHWPALDLSLWLQSQQPSHILPEAFIEISQNLGGPATSEG
eukprot:3939050-Rhodomonas_salina.1